MEEGKVEKEGGGVGGIVRMGGAGRRGGSVVSSLCCGSLCGSLSLIRLSLPQRFAWDSAAGGPEWAMEAGRMMARAASCTSPQMGDLLSGNPSLI